MGTLSEEEVDVIEPPRRLMKPTAQVPNDGKATSIYGGFGKELNVLLGNAKKQLENHAKAVRELEEKTQQTGSAESRLSVIVGDDEKREPAEDLSFTREYDEARTSTTSPSKSYAEKAFLTLFATKHKDPLPTTSPMYSVAPKSNDIDRGLEQRHFRPESTNSSRRMPQSYIYQEIDYSDSNQPIILLGKNSKEQQKEFDEIMKQVEIRATVDGSTSRAPTTYDYAHQVYSDDSLDSVEIPPFMKARLTSPIAKKGVAKQAEATQSLSDTSKATIPPLTTIDARPREKLESSGKIKRDHTPTKTSPKRNRRDSGQFDQRSTQAVTSLKKVLSAASFSSIKSGKDSTIKTVRSTTSTKSIPQSSNSFSMNSTQGSKRRTKSDLSPKASVASRTDSASRKLQSVEETGEKLNALAKSLSVGRSNFSKLDSTRYQKEEKIGSVSMTPLGLTDVQGDKTTTSNFRARDVSIFIADDEESLSSMRSDKDTISRQLTPQYQFSFTSSLLSLPNEPLRSFSEAGEITKSTHTRDINRKIGKGNHVGKTDASVFVNGNEKDTSGKEECESSSPPYLSTNRRIKLLATNTVVSANVNEVEKVSKEIQDYVKNPTKQSKIAKLAKLVSGRISTSSKKGDINLDIKKGNVAKLKEKILQKEKLSEQVIVNTRAKEDAIPEAEKIILPSTSTVLLHRDKNLAIEQSGINTIETLNNDTNISRAGKSNMEAGSSLLSAYNSSTGATAVASGNFPISSFEDCKNVDIKSSRIQSKYTTNSLAPKIENVEPLVDTSSIAKHAAAAKMQSLVADKKNRPSSGTKGIAAVFPEQVADEKASQEEHRNLQKNAIQNSTAIDVKEEANLNGKDSRMSPGNLRLGDDTTCLDIDKTLKVNGISMTNEESSPIKNGNGASSAKKASRLSTDTISLAETSSSEVGGAGRVAKPRKGGDTVPTANESLEYGGAMINSLLVSDKSVAQNSKSHGAEETISEDAIEIEAIEFEISVRDETEKIPATIEQSYEEHVFERHNDNWLGKKIDPQNDSTCVRDIVFDERKSYHERESPSVEEIHANKKKNGVLKRFFANKFRKNSKNLTLPRDARVDTLLHSLSEAGISSEIVNPMIGNDNDNGRAVTGDKASKASAGIPVNLQVTESKIASPSIDNEMDASRQNAAKDSVTHSRRQNQLLEPIVTDHGLALSVNTDPTSPQHSVMTYRAQLCIEEVQQAHKILTDESFNASEKAPRTIPVSRDEVQLASVDKDQLTKLNTTPETIQNVIAAQGMPQTSVDLPPLQKLSTSDRLSRIRNDSFEQIENAHLAKNTETSFQQKAKDSRKGQNLIVGSKLTDANQSEPTLEANCNQQPNEMAQKSKKRNDTVKENDGNQDSDLRNTAIGNKTPASKLSSTEQSVKLESVNRKSETNEKERKLLQELTSRVDKKDKSLHLESAVDGAGKTTSESKLPSTDDSAQLEDTRKKGIIEKEKKLAQELTLKVDKKDKSRHAVEETSTQQLSVKRSGKATKTSEGEKSDHANKTKAATMAMLSKVNKEKTHETEKSKKDVEKSKAEEERTMTEKEKSKTEQRKAKAEAEKLSQPRSSAKKYKLPVELKSNNAQSKSTKTANELKENTTNEMGTVDMNKGVKSEGGEKQEILQEKSRHAVTSTKIPGIAPHKSEVNGKNTASDEISQSKRDILSFQCVVVDDIESTIKIVGKTADFEVQEKDANQDEVSTMNTSKKSKNKRKDGFFGFGRKKVGPKVKIANQANALQEVDKMKITSQKHVSLCGQDNVSISEVSMKQKMRVDATSDDDASYPEDEPDVTNSFVKELLTPRGRLSVEQVTRDAGIRTHEVKLSTPRHLTTKKIHSPKNDESYIPSNIPRVISHVSRPTSGNGSLLDDEVSEATSPTYIAEIPRKSNQKYASRKAGDSDKIRGRKTSSRYSVHEDGISVQASRHSTSSVSKFSARTTKSKWSSPKFKGTHITDEEVSQSATILSKAISKARKNKLETDDVSLSPSIKSIQCSYDDELSDPYNARNAVWGTSWNWLW